MKKFTRYHFQQPGITIVVESNEISAIGERIKYDGSFYRVITTYHEILTDGGGVYHHECSKLKDI
jgi:disulfide oxidoreductase YuzD